MNQRRNTSHKHRNKSRKHRNASHKSHKHSAASQKAQNTKHDTCFRRVIIKGTLITQGDLHIGTGEMYEFERHEANSNETLTSLYNTIALTQGSDAQSRKPYLPGSSLRGLLASLLNDEHRYKTRWFGDARGYDEDHGAMGALRIYDAVAKQTTKPETEPKLITRTAIDHVTGTAQQHQLATHHVVKQETSFSVEIALDTKPTHDAELITQAEIQALIQALQQLNGAQIGKGKSVGQGGLRWSNKLTAMGLSNAAFRKWLKGNLHATKVHNGKPTPPDKEQDLHYTEITLDNSKHALTEGLAKQWRMEYFQLTASGALLINNPHDPDVKKKQHPDTTEQEKKTLPDLAFLQQGRNKAVIPASSIKGWFRAQARKILMTLVQDETGCIHQSADSRVDAMLQHMFGGKQTGQSLIRFYDVSVGFTPETDIHEQTFNAVDRFTGGVKASALYRVRALRTSEPFRGRIAYHDHLMHQENTGWMRLLWLFLWRDATDGDLVLGWGKSRGYGRMQLSTSAGNPWIDELATMDEAMLLTWERQLYEQLHEQPGLAQEEAA